MAQKGAALALGPSVVSFASVFDPAWIGWIGAVVIGLSIVGQYLLLRRAGVR